MSQVWDRDQLANGGDERTVSVHAALPESDLRRTLARTPDRYVSIPDVPFPVQLHH